MPTSSPPPVPRTDDGTAPRSSAHCRISWWPVSTLDLDDEPDLVLPRDEALREELLRFDPRLEEALRKDLLPDELPRVEALLLLRDSDVWLPRDLFVPELPENELFDLPDRLPEADDRLRDDDDLVPDDLEVLRALLLDLCAMEILPPLSVR
jgi:hypothetical protein